MKQTLSESEKKQIIEDILGANHNAVGKNFPVFSSIIDYVSYADNALTLAELLPTVNVFLAGSTMTAVASGLSVASIALLPFAQIINLINANQTGRRQYSYIAIAYTVTGWVYNAPKLFESKRRISNMRSRFPTVPKDQLQLYHHEWRETMVSVLSELELMCCCNRITRKQLQTIFKAISGGNSQQLCLQAMKGFEKEFGHTTRNIWQSEYKILYPN